MEPNDLQVVDNSKKMWIGSILDCFSNVANVLGGPGTSKDSEDDSWEVPFDSIEDMSYLGAGAQGVVFAGRFRGEMIAVKKVRDLADTDVLHLRKLEHENIVRMLGVCTITPDFCLLLEFCQYGSLFDFLHSGSNLLPSQIMKWASEIAMGMDYLHSQNIIHRDLKSPNVLIGDDFTVKVSDFGTSREWDNASTVMSFTGTVAWMAPEVIRHEPCSAKVDVWAFGVVLWELITLEQPYKNLETHAIMWGVGTDTLSLPIPTGCPTTLQTIMSQCWQRWPRNRPPFKIIRADIKLAAPIILAIEPEIFAARQTAWGAEARESMEKIYAKESASGSHSVSGLPPEPAPGPALGPAPATVEVPKPREDLRQVKDVYEQQINRANQLFMEVCTVRLQLEQRERALAEREKMLKACRCGQRKTAKIQRQPSSTSSDSKPECVNRKQPAQMLVNYIDKHEGMTYTVAVSGCLCANTARNNNPKPIIKEIKDTVVEKNGNVEINTPPQNKPKPTTEDTLPDVAHV